MDRFQHSVLCYTESDLHMEWEGEGLQLRLHKKLLSIFLIFFFLSEQLIAFVSEERSRGVVYPPGTYFRYAVRHLLEYKKIDLMMYLSFWQFLAKDVFSWTAACPINEVSHRKIWCYYSCVASFVTVSFPGLRSLGMRRAYCSRHKILGMRLILYSFVQCIRFIVVHPSLGESGDTWSGSIPWPKPGSR